MNIALESRAFENRPLVTVAMLIAFLGAPGLSNVAFSQNSPALRSALVSPPSDAAPADNGENELAKHEANPGPGEAIEVIADPATLLPDLRPVPVAKATLIGGTIEKLDRVRDQMTLNGFGGGHMKIMFDPRTRIYLRGTDGSVSDLHSGERVYLDTILDGTTVFARSIRLKTSQNVGESQGVVVGYKPDRNELTVRDAISPTPLQVRLNSSTHLTQGDHEIAATSLAPGSLIAVKFSLEGTGHEVAREISVLAFPGTSFTFAGQIENLDLHTGLLVLNSSTDHKTYEIYLDSSVAADETLHTGAVVTVIANFDGSRYVARSFTLDSQK